MCLYYTEKDLTFRGLPKKLYTIKGERYWTNMFQFAMILRIDRVIQPNHSKDSMSQALFCHMRLLSSDSPRPAWNASWIKSLSPKPLDDLLWKGFPKVTGWSHSDTSERRWPRLLLVSWMYHPRTMTWQHLHLRSSVHLWFPSDHLKGWCERNKISIFSSNSLANMAFWISLTSQYLPPFSLKLCCLSRFILWFWVSGNQSVGIQWSCLMHMKCPWPRMGTSHTSLVSSGQKWQDCSFHSFLPGFYIDPLVSSMEVHCSIKNGGELMMWEAQLARIHWNLFAVCMSPHMSACQCMLTSGFWASHSFDLSTSIC